MTKTRKMGGDISRINLQGMLLDRLDFSNSRMVQANLRKAVLRDTWLNNVNLQEAQLQEADLRRATFIGSDLREANLDGANLGDADASRADFSDACLVNATLVNASLRHCNLDGADFRGADLTNADLEFAAGYTAAQLGEARSLYQTAGIDHIIESELRGTHPQLFDPPPGFVQSDYKATSASDSKPSVFQTVAALFSRSKP